MIMKDDMKDELWLKKIKDRLDNYSEPLPASGWERLEKELAAGNAPVAKPRRIVPFRRWAVSAAAVLLVAVSSVSLWLLQSPVADEVRRASVPALAVAPDNLPEVTTPAMQTHPAEPLYRAHRGTSASNGNAHRSLVAQQIEITTDDGEEETLLSSGIDDESIDRPAAEPTVQTEDGNTAVTPDREPESRPKERYRPSGKDKLHLPEGKKSEARAKGWAVGLSVGNTGGLLQSGDAEGGNLLQSSAPGGPIYGGNVDLSSTANGLVTIPSGDELVFKDGFPYLQKKANEITSIDHKQPISFGVSVRKNLPKGFSVETGLTYTYLASDVKFGGSSEKVSQKLHYIGIPVRANWNFVDKENFTMYVSGGAAVEKCVYGKIGSKSETVKPVQLSVMGAVGAQYNISNRVGLYVEPGVSYFFDDGSSVQTIRKENKTNFTLQAGIRLTY